MAQGDICNVCSSLETFDDTICAATLVQSAGNGCQACSLLENGISKFVDSFDDVDELRLVVDISLFVSVIWKQEKPPMVIEFYTPPGTVKPRFLLPLSSAVD